MKKIRLVFTFFLVSVITVLKAQTQSPDTSARYFLIHASIGNLQEIAAGKLAIAQGASPEVKAFGRMMVDDHSRAETQLLQLAKAQHIDLPAASTEIPVPDLNLKKANGPDFDRLYVHNMVPGHRQTVMMFLDYGITGKNNAVKTFANETLPTLKAHLKAIKAIDDKMKFAAAK